MTWRNVRAFKADGKKQIACISVLVDDNETFDRLSSIKHVNNYIDLFNELIKLGYDAHIREYHKGAQVKLIIK